jgi:hypothetical protein
MRRLLDHAPIAVLAAVAGCGSFTHIRDTAAEHGQHGWMAWAVAVCVDLTCVMAARERQRDRRLGRRSMAPTLILVGGVVLSLAANVEQAEPSVWGWVMAGVPCGAFLLAVALLERRGGEGEKGVHSAHTPGGEQQVSVVNEPYTLPEPKPVRQAPRKKGHAKSMTPPADLLEKARQIDREHRERHGRRISRDALRTALGCSTGTASQVLKELRTAA